MLEAISSLNHLVPRILISLLFINSAFDKIRRRAVYTDYMEKFGVTRRFLPLTIAIDGLGGLALLMGLLVVPISLGLAIYVTTASIIFHFKIKDVDQMGQFWKNAAIVGGLLLFSAVGAGAFSVDAAALK